MFRFRCARNLSASCAIDHYVISLLHRAFRPKSCSSARSILFVCRRSAMPCCRRQGARHIGPASGGWYRKPQHEKYKCCRDGKDARGSEAFGRAIGCYYEQSLGAFWGAVAACITSAVRQCKPPDACAPSTGQDEPVASYSYRRRRKSVSRFAVIVLDVDINFIDDACHCSRVDNGDGLNITQAKNLRERLCAAGVAHRSERGYKCSKVLDSVVAGTSPCIVFRSLLKTLPQLCIRVFVHLTV